MLLTPRYDAPPLIAVEVRSPGPHPMVQQRERLGALLADLGEDEWLAPSRCEAWSVQDVVTHLNSTNGFWALSFRQAVAGEPTRFLAAFDPVASPAELVDSTRGTPPADTLATYLDGVAALRGVVEELDEGAWDLLGEAPPGHVPLRVVADHALWDCWVHERDIALPLGRTPVEDPVEVLTCLRYASALGRAFEVNQRGAQEGGAAVLEVSDPDARIVVTADGEQVRTHDGEAPPDAVRIELPAVALLEMLSIREAGQPVPAEVGWLTSGLATVFDQVDV